MRRATDTSNDDAWVITTCRKGGSRHSAPFPDIGRTSQNRTFTARRNRASRISAVWAGCMCRLLFARAFGVAADIADMYPVYVSARGP